MKISKNELKLAVKSMIGNGTDAFSCGFEDGEHTLLCNCVVIVKGWDDYQEKAKILNNLLTLASEQTLINICENLNSTIQYHANFKDGLHILEAEFADHTLVKLSSGWDDYSKLVDYLNKVLF